MISGAQLYAGSGSNGSGGSLYIINQSNGAVQSTVGAFMDLNGRAYGMTGMAFASNGTLYGSTSNSSPTDPGWLVSINPTTAVVTPIGQFSSSGSPMSDLTFIGSTLYGWQSFGNHALFTVDVNTGAATLVGTDANLTGQFGGGALAANGSSLFAAPDSASSPPGHLYSINPGTGQGTLIGTLTITSGHALNAAQFIGGTMYAIDTDRGGTALTQLATVNTATGAVTDLGPSADNLDALAFHAVPEPASIAGIGLGLAAILRRRRAGK